MIHGWVIEMRILDVSQSNVQRYGFFCYMSKRRSVGYQRKMRWLEDRFAEGLTLKLLELPDRGFVEYIPGEFAWRTVEAKGYMFIHCLWVVGKSKGKGCATALIDACVRDAKKAKLKGVAMLTSEGNWLVGRSLLEKHGFECVAEAPPSFSLMVRRFGTAKPPTLVDNRAAVRRRFGKGLTVVRSDQCPYIEDATANAIAAAEQAGIPSSVVDLRSAADVRRFSPTPYGVFAIMLDGRLLSYHYLLHKNLKPLLRI